MVAEMYEPPPPPPPWVVGARPALPGAHASKVMLVTPPGIVKLPAPVVVTVTVVIVIPIKKGQSLCETPALKTLYDY
jgi:hypothetical protein